MPTKIRVLLVCDYVKQAKELQQTLRRVGCELKASIRTADDLVKWISLAWPDVVVISVKQVQASLLKQLKHVSTECSCPSVIFTNHSASDTTRAVVKAGVSAYIVNGLSEDRLRPILEIAIARFEELQTLRDELARTRDSLSDRKLIDHAKGILMQQRGIAEAQAFHALRKSAVNQNIKVVEVARNVIAMAER